MRDQSVPSHAFELEQIDDTMLEKTRGGMDPANSTFLWSSLAGTLAYFAARAVRVKAI